MSTWRAEAPGSISADRMEHVIHDLLFVIGAGREPEAIEKLRNAFNDAKQLPGVPPAIRNTTRDGLAGALGALVAPVPDRREAEMVLRQLRDLYSRVH